MGITILNIHHGRGLLYICYTQGRRDQTYQIGVLRKRATALSYPRIQKRISLVLVSRLSMQPIF